MTSTTDIDQPRGGSRCWWLCLPLLTAAVIVGYLYTFSPAVHLQYPLARPLVMHPDHQLLVNTTDSMGEKKILLVTYYRGGSTFLGQLFNQNTQAMYWFEPLRAIANMTLRDRLTQEQKRNLALVTILGLLSCDLSQSPQEVLQDAFISREGKSLGCSEYIRCLRKDDNYTACMPLLAHRCSQSKLKVVKTIRLPMSDVRDLLELDPKIKVIYYQRDPRAMLWSRSKIHLYKNFSLRAQQTCTNLHRDSEHYESLHRQYPDSIISFKYEDVARYPLKTTMKLYSFINEPLPESVRTWIGQNTRSNSDNRTYGTQRNSIETMEKWRYSISERVLNVINSKCQKVLKEIGYQ